MTQRAIWTTYRRHYGAENVLIPKVIERMPGLLAVTQVKVVNQVKVESTFQITSDSYLRGSGLAATNFGDVHTALTTSIESSKYVLPIIKTNKGEIFRHLWDRTISSP